MTLELLPSARKGFVPNPAIDPVLVIAVWIADEDARALALPRTASLPSASLAPNSSDRQPVRAHRSEQSPAYSSQLSPDVNGSSQPDDLEIADTVGDELERMLRLPILHPRLLLPSNRTPLMSVMFFLLVCSYFERRHRQPSQTLFLLRSYAAVFFHRQLRSPSHFASLFRSNVQIHVFPNESTMLGAFALLVQQCDPDIVAGWEVQKLSWGYLLDRARCLQLTSFLSTVSRIVASHDSSAPVFGGSTTNDSSDSSSASDSDSAKEISPGVVYYQQHGPGFELSGRVVLNVWRLARHEIKTLSYTVQNIAFTLFGIRVPSFAWEQLSSWFHSVSASSSLPSSSSSSSSSSVSSPAAMACSLRDRLFALQQIVLRASLVLNFLDALDIIPRCSEMARIFGLTFFDVLLRGSQFRVESMMVRVARQLNFVLISPSAQQVYSHHSSDFCFSLWILQPFFPRNFRVSAFQVAHQPPLECVPLIMEPLSGFYTSPVVVFDFRSLYPGWCLLLVGVCCLLMLKQREKARKSFFVASVQCFLGCFVFVQL